MSPNTKKCPRLSILVPVYPIRSRFMEICPRISKNVPEFQEMSRNLQKDSGFGFQGSVPGMYRHPTPSSSLALWGTSTRSWRERWASDRVEAEDPRVSRKVVSQCRDVPWGVSGVAKSAATFQDL